MLTTDQINDFLMSDERYTNEIDDFVSKATAIFNDRYIKGNPHDTMIIHYLLYNTIENEYTKTIFVPPVVDNTAVAETVHSAIVGLLHPSYCVGYCVSTEAWALKKDDIDENTVLTEINKNPKKLETLIHIIGGSLFSERIVVHEFTRYEEDIPGIVKKGVLTGKDVTGRMSNFYGEAVKRLKRGDFGIDLQTKNVFEE